MDTLFLKWYHLVVSASIVSFAWRSRWFIENQLPCCYSLKMTTVALFVWLNFRCSRRLSQGHEIWKQNFSMSCRSWHAALNCVAVTMINRKPFFMLFKIEIEWLFWLWHCIGIDLSNTRLFWQINSFCYILVISPDSNSIVYQAGNCCNMTVSRSFEPREPV